MKKIIGLVIGMVAMVALSGCNTTGENLTDPVYEHAKVSAEDAYYDGYVFSGYDDIEDPEVPFKLYICANHRYIYQHGDDEHTGRVILQGQDLGLKDDDTGSYVLLSGYNGYYEEGKKYAFDGLDDELVIETIYDYNYNCYP